MTAALEGGEWSESRPGRILPPGKTRYPVSRRLGGPQGRSGRAENLVPAGIRSRTVQPVAQSLYRLSYPAHCVKYIYVCIYTYTDIVVYMYINTYILHMYIYRYMYAYIYIYIYILYIHSSFQWDWLRRNSGRLTCKIFRITSCIWDAGGRREVVVANGKADKSWNIDQQKPHDLWHFCQR